MHSLFSVVRMIALSGVAYGVYMYEFQPSPIEMNKSTQHVTQTVLTTMMNVMHT